MNNLKEAHPAGYTPSSSHIFFEWIAHTNSISAALEREKNVLSVEIEKNKDRNSTPSTMFLDFALLIHGSDANHGCSRGR